MTLSILLISSSLSTIAAFSPIMPVKAAFASHVDSIESVKFDRSTEIPAMAGASESRISAVGSNVYATWSAGADLLFAVSRDNGITFDENIKLGQNVWYPPGFMISAFGGNVFVMWAEYSDSAHQLYFRASNDNGATFGEAIRINGDGEQIVEMRILAQEQNAYVLWLAYGTTEETYAIYFRASNDNGATFGSIINLSNSMPYTYGASIAAFGSSVYAVWAEEENDKVYFRASNDNGATFGDAIILPYSEQATEAAYPKIAAYGTDVFVAYGGAQSQVKTAGFIDIFFVASNDNGATFGEAINLSNSPAHSQNWNLAVSSSRIFLVWDEWHETWFVSSKNNGITFSDPFALGFNLESTREPELAISGNSLYAILNTPIGDAGATDLVFVEIQDNEPRIVKTQNLGFGNTYSTELSASGDKVYLLTPGYYESNLKIGTLSTDPFVHGTLSGRVTSTPDSQPVADAYVTAVQDIDGVNYAFGINTDSQGYYHLDLFPGEGHIEVTRPPMSGSFTQSVLISVDKETVLNVQVSVPLDAANSGLSLGPTVNVSNNPAFPFLDFPGEIAISGDNGYIVWADAKFFYYQVFLAISHDDFASFETINLSNSDANAFYFQIAASGDNVYVTYLTPLGFNRFDVFLARSADAGNTFEIINLNNDPAVSYAKVAASGDNVYVLWYEVDKSTSILDIYLASSSDRGNTFEIINLTNTLDFSDNPNRDQASLAVYDEQVLVAWTENTKILLRTSSDYGASFSEEVIVFEGVMDDQFTRLYPDDPQVLMLGNNVYVAWLSDWWENFRNLGYSAIVAKSSDGGITFSDPIRLGNSGREFKIVAGNENVYAVWSSISFDGIRLENSEIFFARISDTDSNFKVAILSNNVDGGYSPQLAASGEDVYVVWPYTLEEYPNYTYEIALARSTDTGYTFSRMNLSNDPEVSTRPFVAVSDYLLVTWVSEDTSSYTEDVVFRRGAFVEESREATLSGRVTDGINPIKGAFVTATQIVDGLEGTFRTKTDSNGQYSLTLIEGEAKVQAAKPPDGASDISTVILTRDTETVLDLQVSVLNTGTVSVDLFTQHIGEDQAQQVHLDSLQASMYGLKVTVRGITYSSSIYPIPIRGIPGDPVQVCVDGSTFNLPKACETVQLDDQSSAVATIFLVEKGRLTGQVVDGSSGLPVSGWTGKLYQVDEATDSRSFVRSVFGESEILNISTDEGQYQLDISYLSLKAQITANVAAGQVVDIGDIELNEPGLFTGEGNGLIPTGGEVSPGGQVTLRASYSNTGSETAEDAVLLLEVPTDATLQEESVTVDGQPVVGEINGEYYEVSLGDIVPGGQGSASYKLSIGNEIDAEKLVLTGQIQYSSMATSYRDTLGTVNIDITGVTLNAPSNIAVLDTSISGRAPVDSTVRAFDSGILLGETTASRGGFWHMDVTLPDLGDPVLHELRAEAETSSGTIYTRDPQFILYDSNRPELLEFCMEQPATRKRICFDPSEGIAQFAYVLLPHSPIEFKLTFNNPSQVYNVEIILDGRGGGRATAVLGGDGIYRASITPTADIPGSVRVHYNTYEFTNYPDFELPSEEELRLSLLPPSMGDYDVQSFSINEDEMKASGVVTFPQFDNNKMQIEMRLDSDISYSPTADDEARVQAGGFPVYGLDLSYDSPVTFVQVSAYIPQSALDELTLSDLSATDLNNSDDDTLLSMLLLTVAKQMQTLVQPQEAYAAFGWVKVTISLTDDQLELLGNAADATGAVWDGGQMYFDLPSRLNALLGFMDQVSQSECSADVKNDFMKQALDHRTRIFVAQAAKAGVSILGVLLGTASVIGTGGAALVGAGALFAGEVMIATAIDAYTDSKFRQLQTAFSFQKCEPEEQKKNFGNKLADPVWLIDPSGFVYETLEENRLEGVTATLYQKDSTGAFVFWNAADYGQDNPQVTDAEGRYGWDVPEGEWQVTYEKAGYRSTTSEIMNIPPPRTDVNINMVREGGEMINVGDGPTGLAFNPANNMMYVANYLGNTVSVIDGNTVIDTVDVGDGPYGIAFNSANNKMYVTNSDTNTVSVIDGSTVTDTITVSGGTCDIAFNSDSQIMYVTDYGSNSIYLIDGTSVVDTIVAGEGGPCPLAFNPNNGLMYVSMIDSNEVLVIDGIDIVTTIPVGESPYGIAFNPLNNMMYVANLLSDNVSVIDHTTVVDTIPVGDRPVYLSFNEGNGKMYVTNQDADTVSIIDGNTVVDTIGVGDRPEDVEFNPSNNRMYVSNYLDDTISILEATPPPSTNNQPVANDQSATTTEDTPLLITLTGSDSDKDALAFSISSPPSYGTLSGITGTIASFAASLDGLQEVPPNPSVTATGTGTFTYDDSTNMLSYFVEYNGLSSDENGAHIHYGPVGVDGPIIFPLADGNPKSGSIGPLTNDQEAALFGGDWYVNIHSINYPSGEIRGQIFPTGDARAETTYTPNPGFTGTDGFTFAVTDGSLSDTGTVSIVVNPEPLAVVGTTLVCKDSAGNDILDIAPINLNTDIICESSTSNSRVVSNTVMVMDGNGNTIAELSGTGRSATIDFVVDSLGVWSVWVLYYDQQGAELERELLNIHVSFLVIPESAIGAIALIVSSLAALGGFILWRRNHKHGGGTSWPHRSSSSLGI